MQELTYRLDQYEGPLDLLLSLINKSKIDINDIPIAIICDQYMEYIENASRLDMELASEFIVMASELMLIKSRMLLPRDKGGDEQDPRASLTDALLRYKQAKEAAELLAPMFVRYCGRLAKDTDEIRPDNKPPRGLEAELLTRSFNIMLSRLKAVQDAPSKQISTLVKAYIVPVSEKISDILALLRTNGKTSLMSVFLSGSESKSALVATFMALLELIRDRKIYISESDDDLYGDVNGIYVSLCDGYDNNQDFAEETSQAV